MYIYITYNIKKKNKDNEIVTMSWPCSYRNILYIYIYGSVSKPCTPVVHIKIAGKWMFIPLKLVLIGIDPYPYVNI